MSGMEIGRGGLTVVLSLALAGCSGDRAAVPSDTNERDAGVRDQKTGRTPAGKQKNGRDEMVSSADGGADDTELAVTTPDNFADAGPDGGRNVNDSARPKFLPEERPLPTAELVEPDPVEIKVGDTVPAIAVRLGRFIWRSAPDATTVDKARKGQLETAEQVYGEALRLLEDPRAERGFLSFFGAWAEVGVSAANVSAVMASVDAAPGDGDAGITTAEADDVQFGTAARAELDRYFLQLVTSGAGLREFVRQSFEVEEPALVDLFTGEPTIERAGIFSQPWVLAAGSRPHRPSPSRRGAFIARRLLCEDFDASNHQKVGDVPADKSVREWLQAETKADQCAGCHSTVDQLGFALQGFDQTGRARDADGAGSLDTRADLRAMGLPEADSAATLGISLLHHPNTLPCILSHWFKYALQRELTDADDASWVGLVRGSEFYELGEIPALIAATQSFRAE